jgi:hypothetical protein
MLSCQANRMTSGIEYVKELDLLTLTNSKVPKLSLLPWNTKRDFIIMTL